MKFKKSLSLLLSAVMVAGCATVAVTAAESDSESVGYSNQSFLETEAGQAKNTNDFGAKYSTASTTWKTWSGFPSARGRHRHCGQHKACICC